MSKFTDALTQVATIQGALQAAVGPETTITMNTAADFLGHLDANGYGIRTKAENPGRPKGASTQEQGSKGSKS